MNEVINLDISFNCLSCGSVYKNSVLYLKNEKIDFDSISLDQKLEMCSKCSPFFTGENEGYLKLGNVEKFRRKVDKYSKKKEKEEL